MPLGHPIDLSPAQAGRSRPHARIGRSPANIVDEARRRGALAGACAIRLSRLAMAPAVQALLHRAQASHGLSDETRGVLGAYAMARAISSALGELVARGDVSLAERDAILRLEDGVRAALEAWRRLRAEGCSPEQALHTLSARIDGLESARASSRRVGDEPGAFVATADALAAPAWPPASS